MNQIDIDIQFSNTFEGTLQAKNGQLRIGREQDMFAPYELLLGALGGCYYSTFLDIAKKMRLSFERAAFAIHGVKREQTPTTLQQVDMVFTIYGAADEKGFERAAQLAAKYCSVYATLEKVADMHLDVRFQP